MEVLKYIYHVKKKAYKAVQYTAKASLPHQKNITAVYE